MRNKNKIKKSFAAAVKAVSLLMAVVTLVTATPAAIAFDTAALPGRLLEQVFTLTPEDGVTVTLSGFMPKNGSAEAKPADVAGDDVLHAYDISIFYPGENAQILTTTTKQLATGVTMSGGKLVMTRDANGDGAVDIDDATNLQRYLAEYETGMPFGSWATHNL